MSILSIININEGTAVVAVVLCQAVPVLLLQLHTELQPRDTQQHKDYSLRNSDSLGPPLPSGSSGGMNLSLTQVKGSNLKREKHKYESNLSKKQLHLFSI